MKNYYSEISCKLDKQFVEAKVLVLQLCLLDSSCHVYPSSFQFAKSKDYF
jgi:hypothetical protein